MKLAHQPARTPEAAGRRAALAGYIQVHSPLLVAVIPCCAKGSPEEQRWTKS